MEMKPDKSDMDAIRAILDKQDEPEHKCPKCGYSPSDEDEDEDEDEEEDDEDEQASY